MNNPLIYALKANPEQFLKGLEVPEIDSVMTGCVMVLAARAKGGDRKAALALQQVYRIIGAVEI